MLPTCQFCLRGIVADPRHMVANPNTLLPTLDTLLQILVTLLPVLTASLIQCYYPNLQTGTLRPVAPFPRASLPPRQGGSEVF